MTREEIIRRIERLEQLETELDAELDYARWLMKETERHDNVLDCAHLFRGVRVLRTDQ